MAIYNINIRMPSKVEVNLINSGMALLLLLEIRRICFIDSEVRIFMNLRIIPPIRRGIVLCLISSILINMRGTFWRFIIHKKMNLVISLYILLIQK